LDPGKDALLSKYAKIPGVHLRSKLRWKNWCTGNAWCVASNPP
jgi:hypothetical protein